MTLSPTHLIGLCLVLLVVNRVKVASQTVTTFAGSGAIGSADGTGTGASFYNPYGLAFDATGNLFVADTYNHKIRKITPSGVVSTFAGSGVNGSTDGTGTGATFNAPTSIAIDASGNLFVSDTDNHKIRKITPTGVVTTFAGSVSGYRDGLGTAARFSVPLGITIDSSGTLYVADFDNGKIRNITSSGNVGTFSGTSVIVLNKVSGAKPVCLTIDSAKNLYVLIALWGQVQKFTPAGVSSELKSPNSTDFLSDWPSGVTIDSLGNLYIADTFKHKIRLMTPSGDLSTIAGTGVNGTKDGNATEATFNSPQGISVDASGVIYVADSGNQIIRKITNICLPGNYINSSGTCVTCPTGTYGTVVNSFSCNKCPINTYNSNTGSNSVSACIACPAGSTTAVGSESSSNCTSCPIGSYVNSSGTCVVCPTGTFGSTASSVKCSLCAANTFNTNTGKTDASACVACAVGSTSEAGSSTCIPCPAGSFVNSEGSCISCGKGTYSPSAGSLACTKCPANTYNNKEGRALLSDCLTCADKQTSLEGSEKCISTNSANIENAGVSMEGVIIGSVIGGIALIAISVVAVILIKTRLKKNQEEMYQPPSKSMVQSPEGHSDSHGVKKTATFEEEPLTKSKPLYPDLPPQTEIKSYTDDSSPKVNQGN